jgi:CrcB protein
MGIERLLGVRFPCATLLINITGCFFLGWFMTVLTRPLTISPDAWFSPDDLRLLIAVGFTGAYTTFSTFGYESDRLFVAGDSFLAILYITASVFVGLLAVRLGVLVASSN